MVHSLKLVRSGPKDNVLEVKMGYDSCMSPLFRFLDRKLGEMLLTVRRRTPGAMYDDDAVISNVAEMVRHERTMRGLIDKSELCHGYALFLMHRTCGNVATREILNVLLVWLQASLPAMQDAALQLAGLCGSCRAHTPRLARLSSVLTLCAQCPGGPTVLAELEKSARGENDAGPRFESNAKGEVEQWRKRLEDAVAKHLHDLLWSELSAISQAQFKDTDKLLAWAKLHALSESHLMSVRRLRTGQSLGQTQMMSLVSFLVASDGAATQILPSMCAGETQSTDRELELQVFLEGLSGISGVDEHLVGFARGLATKVLPNQHGLQDTASQRQHAGLLSSFWQWRAGRSLLQDELMILVISQLDGAELDFQADPPYLPPYVPGRAGTCRPVQRQFFLVRSCS